MKLKKMLLQGRQRRHRVGNGRKEEVKRKERQNGEFKRNSHHRKTKGKINY